MEQAAQAASLFAARDYTGCMAVLQQLRAEKEMDPKVSPHPLISHSPPSPPSANIRAPHHLSWDGAGHPGGRVEDRYDGCGSFHRRLHVPAPLALIPS